jgi:hypothetical protein
LHRAGTHADRVLFSSCLRHDFDRTAEVCAAKKAPPSSGRGDPRRNVLPVIRSG